MKPAQIPRWRPRITSCGGWSFGHLGVEWVVNGAPTTSRVGSERVMNCTGTCPHKNFSQWRGAGRPRPPLCVNECRSVVRGSALEPPATTQTLRSRRSSRTKGCWRWPAKRSRWRSTDCRSMLARDEPSGLLTLCTVSSSFHFYFFIIGWASPITINASSHASSQHGTAVLKYL